MGLLSATALSALVDTGVLEGSKYEHVNATSIDIILGSKIMVEKRPRFYSDVQVIDMLDKGGLQFDTIEMTDEGWVVPPGGVLLAHSVEIFNLPNWLSAEYKLKSTQARNFFDHLNAGWCDAGWNGSVLTLEFVNHMQHHAVRIRPGMKCGQVVFFEHVEVPEDKSYATMGQYNGDKSVEAGKGIR
jgi:deoxycytidine triphosphate deaminase